MLRLASLAVLAAGSLLAQTANLLPNAGFEEVAEDRPVGWTWHNFGTGGIARVETGAVQAGERCVALESRDNSERIAWRATVPLPAGTRFVAAGGWYRTEGVAPGSQRGASFRVHFHGTVEGRMREIGLRQAFFPPAEAWTRTAEQIYPVPAGTERVELQVFNWLTPGVTRWDEVWVRPIGDQELATMRHVIAASLGLDQEPVFGRHVPYSPGEGETVKTNPPPFLWLPVRGSRYSLEVARDAAFTREVIRRGDIEWCAEMLTEPLAAGGWFWRYGVAWENGATVWSRTRAFTVPADASPWPYPKSEQFRVAAERPRLFVAPGRLAEIRRRAAEGDLKGMADGLRREVARWAGEELIAEPGWLPEGKDRGPAYTIVFRDTRPPMDKMERAALAYLLTGDAGAGAEAKRRILHFFSWDPHGPTNVFHNDEPAMWIMMRGCRAYDWTHDLFTPEERQLVEASQLERARDFYLKMSRMPFENNPYESHAGRIIGFLGEAAISLAPEHEEARKWLDYITRIYWGVYPAWGKEDGGWNEGPGYWGAYMTFGLHFVVALREATGIDLSQRPFFKSTPYYRLYQTPPYSQMSPFGDGPQFRPHRVGALMYWFSTLNRDPRIRWYPDSLGQDGGNSILGIVLKDDSLPSLPPFDLPPARHFPGVGLVALHTDLVDGAENVAFSLRSSPYGAVSHGHNDQNCFTLEAFGEPLAIATGHYNRYGSPHHDGWTRQTKAKCGITTDGGQGQDRGWNARGRIADYLHGDAFDYVRGDATEAYGGRLDKAVREVVHIRPGIFVLRDDLASAEERVYEYWLHALDQMEVAADTVRIRRPQASLAVRFLVPGQPVFEQTDQFDPPPSWPPGQTFEKQWHLRASQPEAAKEAEFLTVLLPGKTGGEGSLPQVSHWREGAAQGARLAHADGSSTLVGFASAPVRFAGIECDGRAFAVRRGAAGEVLGWMAAGATRLTVDGRELLAAAQPVSATAAFAEVGRVDLAGDGEARFAVPSRYRRGTRPDGSSLPLAETLRLDGADSVDLWAEQPVPPGEVELTLVSGGSRTVLRGLRNRRGEALAQGAHNLPPGVYRLELPESVALSGAAMQADDTLWLGGKERLSFRGRLPGQLAIEPVRLALALPAQPRARLPEGILHEAETGWEETGGAIQVSGGGHRNASGQDNLWGWNLPGHTLAWTVEVPAAGDYELWFVGATETGMAGDLQVNGSTGQALVFAPSGGWGRERAEEWRAYRTAVFTLKAGANRIALTNRSGMGLNLDCLVLVRR